MRCFGQFLCPSPGLLTAVSKSVWHIPLICVQWKSPDGGQRNCPKYVEFYCNNKFEKLVHLVGFIIRIYHEARSPERQMRFLIFIFSPCIFEIYVVHTPTNALFINLVKSFKFTLKYTIISLLHVSVCYLLPRYLTFITT